MHNVLERFKSQEGHKKKGSCLNSAVCYESDKTRHINSGFHIRSEVLPYVEELRKSMMIYLGPGTPGAGKTHCTSLLYLQVCLYQPRCQSLCSSLPWSAPRKRRESLATRLCLYHLTVYI